MQLGRVVILLQFCVTINITVILQFYYELLQYGDIWVHVASHAL